MNKDEPQIQKEAEGQSKETGTQGDQSENIVDRATAAAKELREANAEKKALLDREEALQARRELGGQSEAGFRKEKKTPEQAKVDDAADYFKGTALETAIKNG